MWQPSSTDQTPHAAQKSILAEYTAESTERMSRNEVDVGCNELEEVIIPVLDEDMKRMDAISTALNRVSRTSASIDSRHIETYPKSCHELNLAKSLSPWSPSWSIVPAASRDVRTFGKSMWSKRSGLLQSAHHHSPFPAESQSGDTVHGRDTSLELLLLAQPSPSVCRIGVVLAKFNSKQEALAHLQTDFEVLQPGVTLTC